MPKFRQRDYLNPISFGQANLLEDFKRGFSSGDFTMGDNPEDIAAKNAFSKCKTNEELRSLFKSQMINDEFFPDACAMFLHQGAVPYALSTAIREEVTSNAGTISDYSGDMKSNRTFKVEDGRLFVTEKVSVMNLRNPSDPSEPMFEEDGGSLMDAEARYVISKKQDGFWEAQVKDVSFDYHNETLKQFTDKRGVLTRIKDWFKSKLGMNEDKAFSREPDYLFKKNLDDKTQVEASVYCGKEKPCRAEM